MLIHEWDAGDDREWRAFIATHGFGDLVAGGRHRDLPIVVPTQFVLRDDEVFIHLVRKNPIFTAIEENPNVLLVVAGDWAYIPSDWKTIGEEDPRRGIPTTYYAAAQLVGLARLVDDVEEIGEILRVQLAHLQPGKEVVDPTEHGPRLRAIRGIRIQLADVRAKFKYGGNVDVDHRSAVAERLRARAGPGDEAALGHLQRRLERS
jgi:transcriptional regulator